LHEGEHLRTSGRRVGQDELSADVYDESVKLQAQFEWETLTPEASASLTRAARQPEARAGPQGCDAAKRSTEGSLAHAHQVIALSILMRTRIGFF